MRDELSGAELNEIFYGKKPLIEATFYDKDVVDVEASREAGTRLLKTVTFIGRTCEKEKTVFHRIAKPVDQRQFPDAWSAYLKLKETEHERHREIQNDSTGRTLGEGIAARHRGDSAGAVHLAHPAAGFLNDQHVAENVESDADGPVE